MELTRWRYACTVRRRLRSSCVHLVHVGPGNRPTQQERGLKWGRVWLLSVIRAIRSVSHFRCPWAPTRVSGGLLTGYWHVGISTLTTIQSYGMRSLSRIWIYSDDRAERERESEWRVLVMWRVPFSKLLELYYRFYVLFPIFITSENLKKKKKNPLDICYSLIFFYNFSFIGSQNRIPSSEIKEEKEKTIFTILYIIIIIIILIISFLHPNNLTDFLFFNQLLSFLQNLFFVNLDFFAFFTVINFLYNKR